MRIVQVQFTPWDKIYNFDPNNLELAKGDDVIVKTELGKEMGKVVGFKEIDDNDIMDEEIKEEDKDLKTSVDSVEEEREEKKERREDKGKIKPVIRKAISIDLEKLPNKKEKEEALEFCKKMIDKHKLPMKLVDVHFSFDFSRITFAFIADGRVDFRELVKDLTRHFNRTIRLHQIGIRDEAKIKGDYGPCGRPLCCKKFLGDLTSITSEMAETQQVVHRGSERISGMCGRLMCCLAYEQEGYECLIKKMPLIGTKVNVDGKKGIVVGHHILKQSVDVQFSGKNGEDGVVVEVDLNRKK